MLSALRRTLWQPSCAMERLSELATCPSCRDQESSQYSEARTAKSPPKTPIIGRWGTYFEGPAFDIVRAPELRWVPFHRSKRSNARHCHGHGRRGTHYKRTSRSRFDSAVSTGFDGGIIRFRLPLSPFFQCSPLGSRRIVPSFIILGSRPRPPSRLSLTTQSILLDPSTSESATKIQAVLICRQDCAPPQGSCPSPGSQNRRR